MTGAPATVSLLGMAAFFALSIFALAGGRRRLATPLVYGAALALSAMLHVNAVVALVAAAPAETLSLPMGLPWIGVHFRFDALAAFFVAVVNLGGAAASLYAIGYGRSETWPMRVLPLFPAFLASMNLVVLADDAFTFLVAWECMSLASWGLVVAHHRTPDNLRAGYVYILMASFGTFALLLAFGLLAGPFGNYAFDAMRVNHPAPLIANLALALVLIGTGSKAGLVPLHVWLPLAHPAAPSHVSALMSGVMTKVAIYAFVRVVFDLLGPPAWWWGIVVILPGAASAVIGILSALLEQDLKRVLAYSTIENVGFIFVGLGLALAFRSNGLVAMSVLALTAALFHVLNHALLKSLLFFGSGAVLTSTGIRSLEGLGGLIHRMPVTAVAVLAGCMGISALPPFNAFVSEWLTFQAILLSPALPQWGLKLIVPAAGALLALAVALAAACFVRIFGIAFLGRPRSDAGAQAQETDGFSRMAMILLAALCLGAGILPGFVIDGIGPAVQAVAGGQMPHQAQVAWLSIVPIAQSRSSYNGLLVFFFIAASALMSVALIHLLASRNTRRVPAWDCGFVDPNPALQYTAVSFAQPIRRVFATTLFMAREQIAMPPPGDAAPARLRVRLRDLIWDTFYVPIGSAVGIASERLNVLQFLTIRRYLSLVFLALIILLAVLAIWR
ncbi:MAG: hydrogenase 4 subunit B [Alphaproteobacteria bacterium]|nr:hydrogenase 4 subunit B [Alphaproteobacteria bacterium]MBL7097738.1 hydrogenase 4 subunit B [Alphaproteobacteria bacterium]